jgi:5-formyltetrahydrofolate cyclo-ligase
MDKSSLRSKYKSLRAALSDEAIERQSLAIANQLLTLDVWQKNYYHVFFTIEEKKEVDTLFILHILAGKDKEILVSKSDFESVSMTHFLVTDNTKFQKNSYNIPEPISGLEVQVGKIEVVFVPLLAFDILGNRVGYGKGFYDKFLSECEPETIKIGVSFFEAEAVIDGISKEDIKLDYCITPERVFRF